MEKEIVIIKRGKPDCDKEETVLDHWNDKEKVMIGKTDEVAKAKDGSDLECKADSRNPDNYKAEWVTIKTIETPKKIIKIQQYSIVEV